MKRIIAINEENKRIMIIGGKDVENCLSEVLRIVQENPEWTEHVPDPNNITITINEGIEDMRKRYGF